MCELCVCVSVCVVTAVEHSSILFVLHFKLDIRTFTHKIEYYFVTLGNMTTIQGQQVSSVYNGGSFKSFQAFQ